MHSLLFVFILMEKMDSAPQDDDGGAHLSESDESLVARAKASEHGWLKWPESNSPPLRLTKNMVLSPTNQPTPDAFFHRSGLPGEQMDVSLIAEATNRRKAAADWISVTCNVNVPVASVAEFIDSLKSGHTLNDLLSIICQPVPKPEVRECSNAATRAASNKYPD